jgi:hypothetical protein
MIAPYQQIDLWPCVGKGLNSEQNIAKDAKLLLAFIREKQGAKNSL